MLSSVISVLALILPTMAEGQNDSTEWRPVAATVDSLHRQPTDAPDLTDMSAAKALIRSF